MHASVQVPNLHAYMCTYTCTCIYSVHVNCVLLSIFVCYFFTCRLLGKFEAYENDPNFANYFHSSTPSSSHSPSPSPFPLSAASSRTTPPPTSSTLSAGTHPLTQTLTASHPSQSWALESTVSKSVLTIPTYQRPAVAGDGMVKKGGRECDKVIRSLVSGFPNEVDFALNVLTMMSFDKPESVPIAKVMLQCRVACI